MRRCPLIALVLAPAVARFQGGEVASGAVEPWVRDLAELCPPGVDAPCDFRERPGCRDGLRGRYGLPERAFADRALPIATPENARLFPPRFDARGRLERFAVVNVTLQTSGFPPVKLIAAQIYGGLWVIVTTLEGVLVILISRWKQGILCKPTLQTSPAEDKAEAAVSTA